MDIRNLQLLARMQFSAEKLLPWSSPHPHQSTRYREFFGGILKCFFFFPFLRELFCPPPPNFLYADLHTTFYDMIFAVKTYI
jgi:hypothetical protein